MVPGTVDVGVASVMTWPTVPLVVVLVTYVCRYPIKTVSVDVPEASIVEAKVVPLVKKVVIVVVGPLK